MQDKLGTREALKASCCPQLCLCPVPTENSKEHEHPQLLSALPAPLAQGWESRKDELTVGNNQKYEDCRLGEGPEQGAFTAWRASELNVIRRVINIFRDVQDGIMSMKQQGLYFYKTDSRRAEKWRNVIVAIKSLMDGSVAEWKNRQAN